MAAHSLEDLFSLENKTAVITGGGGVLCGAIAEGFLAAGASVFLLDLDGERAASQVNRLKESFPRGAVHALTCDVLERKELERACDVVLERSGRINILVNGAGGNHPSATTDPDEDMAFFDLPEEGFRKTFDLNFTGTVLCCQVFGKAMLEFGPGSIINIASMSGFTPLTRVPAYSAAKAAILNFTRWLAVDMAKNYSPRLRVNAVAPGFFHTTQNHFLLYDERGGNRALTERGRTIMTHTPMTRFGREDDLIGATVWLASEGAAFVTGTVVIVDGGFCAFSGV